MTAFFVVIYIPSKQMGALGYESFIRIATLVIDPILGEVFQ